MINKSLNYNDFIFIVYNSTEKIRTITFQVTEDCNLKCTYCYQINKTKNKLDFETAKKFVDYIFSDPDNPEFPFNKENTQGFIFDYIGGEPFLEIDLIEQILLYIENKLLELNYMPWILSHMHSFSSNGTLYFTPRVQEFLEKYRHIVSIGITVDGDKKLHDKCRLFPDGTGSYDLAIQAALEELRIHRYTGTKITLSPENVDYIFDGITSLFSLGFSEIHANCCFEDVWTKESAVKLLNELIRIADWIKENNLYDKIYFALLDPEQYRPTKDSDLESNWCGAGGTNSAMYSVNYTGKIYPCLRFAESSLDKNLKPISIGHIDYGILKTDEEKNNNDLLLSCSRKKLCVKECLNCPIGSGCSWCLGANYQLTGGFNTKMNTICETYKMCALASKYLCKIVNDMDNYKLIQLNYELYKDLIPFEFYNNTQGGK